MVGFEAGSSLPRFHGWAGAADGASKRLVEGQDSQEAPHPVDERLVVALS